MIAYLKQTAGRKTSDTRETRCEITEWCNWRCHDGKKSVEI